MHPDRVIAMFFLAFSVSYGVIAWQYPLLPFETRVLFKPNTLPLGLAAVTIVLSFAVAVRPGGENGYLKNAVMSPPASKNTISVQKI